MNNLETYFQNFRKDVVGDDATFVSPYGEKKVVYADWIASGRLYRPIEEKILNDFGPFVANTHTETSETGTRMTQAYHWAHKIIKEHVNAGPEDVIITAGFGMTAVINKLIRIMGLRGCGALQNKPCIKEMERPVVFITHMEHHSNHTSWLETVADVEIIPPGEGLVVDPENLRTLIEKYKDRRFKIGSFTACSNVTGVKTPYYAMARVMHEYGGYAFIDFAASAPYVDIDMHPEDEMEKLDAVFFSPHKFLGGPGSSGVMIFDAKIYDKNKVPDHPGGGTVDWTNPWNEYKYVDSIEAREDGGTPGFLQAIKTALSIRLKEQMDTAKIEAREKELVDIAFPALAEVEGVRILADNIKNRLGILSFYIENVHFNLVVKLLNDRFGIQVRGGCACAGTYGHYLLEVSYETSKAITDKINHGDLSEKPGWIRWSLHPTMTNHEVYDFVEAVKQVAANHAEWAKDYIYDNQVNEFFHKDQSRGTLPEVQDWFKI